MSLLIELAVYCLLIFVLPFPLSIVVVLVGLASLRLIGARHELGR
jgi:hypothetical protein